MLPSSGGHLRPFETRHFNFGWTHRRHLLDRITATRQNKVVSHELALVGEGLLNKLISGFIAAILFPESPRMALLIHRPTIDNGLFVLRNIVEKFVPDLLFLIHRLGVERLFFSLPLVKPYHPVDHPVEGPSVSMS